MGINPKRTEAKSEINHGFSLIPAGKHFFLLFILPLLIPVVWMLQTISHYGVNMPYSDEWLIVPIFEHMSQGLSLGTLHDLWHAQNYHRLFFTQAFITALAKLTHWDTKADMYASLVFCLVTAGFVYLLVRRTIKNAMLAVLAMLAAAFWLFSPVQSENWLWGWDIAWFICTAAAVASIYFVSRARGKHLYIFLGAAIASGLISIYSFGWGQAIWPVGLLMLLAQKQRRKPIVIWLIASLLAYCAYYFHFTHSGPPIPVFAFVNQPINAICYLFVMFGRPFSYDLYPAMCLGAILILGLVPVAFMVWDKRDRIKTYLPWLSIMLFCLIGAVMILLGRLVPNHPTPLTDAMQPRYTAMSILYVVSLNGFLLSVADGMALSKKALKYVVMVLLVVQIPLLFSSYYVGLVKSEEHRVLLTRLHNCSNQPIEKVTKDCLSTNNYLNNTTTAKQQLMYLKGKHWAGY